MGEIASLKKLLLVSALIATAICRVTAGAVIYVDDDGPADFNNIQAAIDSANNGDIIEVQPGTYTGDGNRDIDFLSKAVTVRGTTGDANDCIIDCQGTEAEPHRGFKFVSGEDSNSVLEDFTITNGYAPEEYFSLFMYSIGGAIHCNSSSPTINNCIIVYNTAAHHGGGIWNDNSSPTISNCTISYNTATQGGGICNKVNSNPIIRNCTIRDNSTVSQGGGIYNYKSSPTIGNCTISYNSAFYKGGGIYNYDSNSTLNNCTISNNSVTGHDGCGGGIYNYKNSPTISNCTINNNSANNYGSYGGGIYNYTSSPTISDCNVSNNSASSFNGYGGGIYTYTGSPTIDNCTISYNSATQGSGIFTRSGYPIIINCAILNNSADSHGGGIYISSGYPIITNCAILNNSAASQGGGIFNFVSSSTITNCSISNNTSDNGGGIHNVGYYSKIIHCNISNNSAHSYGGGCYNRDVNNLPITNCTITNNSANSGGGIYNYNNSSPFIRNCNINNNLVDDYGGGIYNNDDSNPTIGNCTISNNSATSGGGIYNYDNSNPTVNSCIIWSNSPPQIDGTAIVKYSDILGGFAGVGNIDADPCFVDDYHLSVNSLCIDAGDPNYISWPNETDLDGEPRVLGRLDMGADEFYAYGPGALFVMTKHYEFHVLGINSNTPPQSLCISNYGELDLNWEIEIPDECDWLRVWALSGQTASLETSEVLICIDHNNIDYGTFSCQLNVSDPNAQNSPQVVTVHLEVLRPVLTVIPAQFYFETFLAEPNTTKEILSIQNTGYDTLNWDVNIPAGCNWLNASEISGQSTGEVDEVTLSIDHNNIERGLHQCEILISAPDAENSPQVIFVDFRVIGIKGQRYVPTEYLTIQRAIDAAVDGDEVIIEPGIYTGPGNYKIDFKGKAITVRSVEPNNPAVVAATIIEANTVIYGFRFESSEQADSVVDGLTIRNYIAWGILCLNSSPTIRNCIIGNTFGFVSTYYGQRGISCHESSALISNCVIRNNYGSGLWSSMSDLTVRNCIFTGNRGSYIRDYDYETLFGGAILFGEGMYPQESSPMITNCIFSGNSADFGGGICSFGNYAYINNITIRNCIFRDNIANNGPQIALINYYYYKDNPSTVSVSYSDVEGGEAAVYVDPCCTLEWNKDNNLDIDPCFAEPGYWELNGTPEDANDDFWVDGDYHLKSQKGRWKPSIYIGLDPTADGFINLFDFAAFANSWQKQGGFIPADLNSSGTVDSFDLKLLLDNYLSSYNSGQWVLDNATSPCIDAGDPCSDRIGELWPHGMRINIGAYGGTPEASMSLSDEGNIADLNWDGSAGYADIILFMVKWLDEGILIAEDFDRNGFVNFTDFAIFAKNWEGSPGLAGNPNPANDARLVDPDADLSWTAGYGASSHDVYFGTSDPPPFIGNQTTTTFEPGTMSHRKYYWRIDEVNICGTTKGTVWSFTTTIFPPPPLP